MTGRGDNHFLTGHERGDEWVLRILGEAIVAESRDGGSLDDSVAAWTARKLEILAML